MRKISLKNKKINCYFLFIFNDIYFLKRQKNLMIKKKNVKKKNIKKKKSKKKKKKKSQKLKKNWGKF